MKTPFKMKLNPHNSRIPSKGWKVDLKNKELLVSPTGDIWEIRKGKEKGEQLFTHQAAKREAKKYGWKIPTDKEWSKLVKSKEDIPNLVFTGYRTTSGLFYNRGVYTYFWSSSESGASAWLRNLYYGYSTVYRHAYSQDNGFAVRCLKDSSTSLTLPSKKPTLEIVQKKKVKFSDSNTIYSEEYIEFEGKKYTLKAAENEVKLFKKEIARFKKLTF